MADTRSSQASNSHHLKAVRATSILEAISYLLLLFIAMPLKYVWEQPIAVKIAGMIHGALFIVLCLVLLQALYQQRLSIRWACIVLLASLVPLVPFWVDRKLRHLEAPSPETVAPLT